MANCPNTTGLMTGRAILLELAEGCADTVPSDSEFKALGPMTSKDLDFSINSTSSEADDGGGFVATVATTSDLTISGEGEVRAGDKFDEFGIHRLISIFVTEQKARRQPTFWVRRTMGSTVITMYAVLTALSTSGGTNDIVTFSVEFHPADGDTVTVESLESLEFTTNLPTSKVATAGSNAVFGPVVVTGGLAPYSYQWYYEGIPISSSVNATAVTDTLTNSAVTGASAGDYWCVVTDSSSPSPEIGTSNTCKLTISAAAPLAFSTNLDATETVTAGSTLTLTVVATGGVSPLSYLWRKNGVVIPGAVAATYTKATAAEADEGVYTVEVSDTATPTANKITSVACTVTVN